MAIDQAQNGGRPRRRGIFRHVTVCVELDTHDRLKELARIYNVSQGKLVDMMTERAMRRLEKKTKEV